MVVWRAPTSASRGTAGSPLAVLGGGHTGAVSSVSVSGDSARVASASAGASALALWDVERAGLERKLPGHGHGVGDVVFGGVDSTSVIVSGGDDCRVRIWDVRAACALVQDVAAAKDAITGVVDTEAKAVVVVSSTDGTLATLDVRMGRLRTDDLASGPVASVALTADHELALAVVVPIERVALVDVESGDVLVQYAGHNNKLGAKLQACATGSDAHVALGDESGRVHVWDLVEGTHVGEIQAHADTAVVTAVAYHANRNALLTTGTDGLAHVWTQCNP